jgi:hypothetical protein
MPLKIQLIVLFLIILAGLIGYKFEQEDENRKAGTYR